MNTDDPKRRRGFGRLTSGAKRFLHRTTSVRVRKLLRWFGSALVLSYLSYLVLINVALNTGLVARIVNAAQQDMVLSVESGWSAWPLHLHLRNVRLRFEDANVQFSLHAARVETDIDVLAAADKTFHAYRVRAEGGSFWFRHKLDDIEGNARRVAAFPVIAGYDPVPLRVPWTPPDTATEDLWVIRLDDVQAETLELWMMEFRFLGAARVSGSFELAPRRHLWIEDAQITFERGKLDLGEVEVIAQEFTGQIRAEFEERNPDDFTMDQNLGWTNWGLDVKASLDNARFLAAYLGPDVALSGGPGPLRVSVQTLGERIVDGSRVRYSTKTLSVRSGSLQGRVAGSLAFDVKAGSPHIALSVSRARLGSSDEPRAVMVRELSVRAVLAHAELDRTLQLQSLRAQVATARTTKGGLALPGGFRLDGGIAKGQFAGRTNAQGRLAGKVSAALLRTTLRHGAHVVDGIGKVSAGFVTSSDWLAGGRLTDVRAELTDVATRSGEDKNADWWLGVKSPAIDYEALPPRAFHGKLTLSARDARPLIAALEEEGELPAIVGFLWTADHLRGEGEVRSTPHSLDLLVTRVDSDSLGGKGRYLKRGERERAVFLVKAGPIGVGFELGERGLSASPLSSNTWFEARTRAVFGAESDEHGKSTSADLKKTDAAAAIALRGKGATR